MIDKKQLIEELMECVQDATDTETKITGLTMCATLFESVLDEAINYSRCCETLKCKEETAFELWLKNFEESNGCYWFDKETLYVKQAMKEIYEKEVKPKL